MDKADVIVGRDPGDENDTISRPGFMAGPWEPGFPGVPRGTSQPELNIPPFEPKTPCGLHHKGPCNVACGY